MVGWSDSGTVMNCYYFGVNLKYDRPVEDALTVPMSECMSGKMNKNLNNFKDNKEEED